MYVKSKLYNSMHMMRFWKNLHQDRSMSKDW